MAWVSTSTRALLHSQHVVMPPTHPLNQQGGDDASLGDLWRLDLQTGHLAEVQLAQPPGLAPCPRECHAAAAVGANMVVYGGGGSCGWVDGRAPSAAALWVHSLHAVKQLPGEAAW